MKDLQTHFKPLREQLELSQFELAHLLGLNGNYIWQIENGKKPVSDRKPLGILFSLLQRCPQAVIQALTTKEPLVEEPGVHDDATDALKQLVGFTLKDASAHEITSMLQWALLNMQEPYKNVIAKLLTGMLRENFE